MRVLLTIISLALLLLSCARLFSLDHKELLDRRASLAETRFMPTDGSLTGVAEDGRVLTPGPGGRGDMAVGTELLVFAIHSGEGTRDIRWWNEVVRRVAIAGSHARSKLLYWGICDHGRACGAYTRSATFPIFGFLDPYEMRIVALADERHEALLYRMGAAVRPVAAAASAAAEARLIVNAMERSAPPTGGAQTHAAANH